MLLPFKIQAQLHIKGRNGPSQVVIVVDGVKYLHHEHSLVPADICDYRSRGVKGQIFFKPLT